MLEAVLIVRPLGLVEIVHVELPDERGEVVVLEKSGQNCLREFILLFHHERFSVRGPRNDVIILLVLMKC
jgi:hypothetical protein